MLIIGQYMIIKSKDECTPLSAPLDSKTLPSCALSIPLLQKWADTTPAEAGLATVGHSATGIEFSTSFIERTPWTTATENNQKLFLLGSVAEFFIQPEGPEGIHAPYWEIHLSPNSLIMDIKIPNRDEMFKDAYPWEELIAPDSHATYKVATNEYGWSSEICIPWEAFGRNEPPLGESWRFAVCRYNYPDSLENPELSATPAFTELGFHRIEEYDFVKFL